MSQLRLATPPRGIPGRFDIRRTSHAPRPMVARPRPGTTDAETVIARLEEAGRTLLSLSRTERRRVFPADPAAPCHQLARMDQALGWIALVPAETLVLRRILGCRSLVSPRTGRHLFSWHRLARLLRADHLAVRRWHATGIDIIVAALNREAAIARSWDEQSREGLRQRSHTDAWPNGR